MNFRFPFASRDGGKTIEHSDADGAKHLPRAQGLANGLALVVQGGRWVASTLSGVSVASVFGRTGAVVAQTGDYTAAQVGAEPAAGSPSVTSFWRSTAAGVRAWVQLVAADITDLATVLGAYLTENNPTYTGVLSGPLAKIGTTTSALGSVTQLIVASTTDVASIKVESTAAGKLAAFWANTPNGDGLFEIRDDGLDGCPVGAWAIRHTSGFAMWGNGGGVFVRKPLDVNGAVSQAGTTRITAGGGFRGIDAKLIGAGSDTFGSAPGVLMADAATDYSNACAVQMTAAGGMAFWTWTGSVWRNYWSITYLGTLRNSSFSGGGTRPVYVNNSGDLTPTGPDLFVTKTASYNFTGITASLIKHSSGDVVATLSGGAPGKKYTLVSASTLLIVIPAGVTLYGTSGIWDNSTGFSLGGMRPIMLQCMSSTEWLIPNYTG